MPNKNLKDKIYNFDGEQLNYQALAMRLSRMEKEYKKCSEEKNCGEFNNMGGKEKYNRLKNIIKKEQEADYKVKKAKQEGGLENQFIKGHNKNSSKNPTKTQNARSKSVYKSLMAENEYSIEILKIKYLLEYINNIKKKL